MGQLLRFPVDLIGITKQFSDTHRGIDLGWRDNPNVPVYAAGSGKVISAKQDSYGANYVVIRHAAENGRVKLTRYWHLDSFSVKKGAVVSLGQQIGIMGKTGNATGVHLHFEVNEFTAAQIIFTEKQCRAAAIDPLRNVYCFTDQKLVYNDAAIMVYNGVTADQLAVSYMGKVIALAGLNVRSTPNGTKISALKYAVSVRITAEQDGWGQLETGGWVSLKYIKKIATVAL